MQFTGLYQMFKIVLSIIVNQHHGNPINNALRPLVDSTDIYILLTDYSYKYDMTACRKTLFCTEEYKKSGYVNERWPNIY